MPDDDSKQPQLNVTGFDYCFWAKALVGVPALTILSFYSASYFDNPFMQVVVGAVVPVAAAWLAMKLDRMPIFSTLVIRQKKDK